MRFPGVCPFSGRLSVWLSRRCCCRRRRCCFCVVSTFWDFFFIFLRCVRLLRGGSPFPVYSFDVLLSTECTDSSFVSMDRPNLVLLYIGTRGTCASLNLQTNEKKSSCLFLRFYFFRFPLGFLVSFYFFYLQLFQGKYKDKKMVSR
jgi:hypothetical protein